METGPDLPPASELRRLAQEVGVWEADLVPEATAFWRCQMRIYDSKALIAVGVCDHEE